jgi:hypothetical protein
MIAMEAFMSQVEKYWRDFNHRHESIGARLTACRREVGSDFEMVLRQYGRVAIGPFADMREILDEPPSVWWAKLNAAGFTCLEEA